MTKIYIVRHGETDSNVRGTCIGQTDVPLNQKGIEQAKAEAERLHDVKFDAVYISPLKRAEATARLILRGREPMKLVQSYNIAERDFGIFEDLTFDEIDQRYPAEYKQWKADWTGYRIPEGESAEDVQARVNKAVAGILRDNVDKTVLLVTHLAVGRHIISALLGLTTEQSWRFFIGNARAAVVEIGEGKKVLTGLNI